jgi:hypothetical protein
MMYGCARWIGSAAIAIACALPAGAIATPPTIQLVQNAPDVVRDGASQPANSPEQIKKAQTELKRLDCLKGRVDGKLGKQTRQAVKSFWIMAKRPVVEVNITDELISDLAERGDNYCRPARPFFAIGGRPGGGFPLAPVLRH